MKALTFVALLTILGSGCHTPVKGQKANTVKTQLSDTTQPQVSWKVNRRVDSKGNLIGYDSTYSWSYTSNGKAGTVSVDSVMKEFKKRFSTQFDDVFYENFGVPEWNDSLYYKDFFKQDYYLEKWMHDNAQMRSFLRQMDSSRNEFFNKQYPGLVPKTKS